MTRNDEIRALLLEILMDLAEAESLIECDRGGDEERSIARHHERRARIDAVDRPMRHGADTWLAYSPVTTARRRLDPTAYVRVSRTGAAPRSPDSQT